MAEQADPHARGFGIANGYMLSALIRLLIKNGMVSQEDISRDFTQIAESFGLHPTSETMTEAKVVRETLEHVMA
jgi:hypothetical protein